MAEVLHVKGKSLDPDDLTYKEKRNVRRLVRKLWDEEVDGDFDWNMIADDDVIPPTIAVFWHRDRPDDSLDDLLEEAQTLKPSEVMPPDPPTEAVAESAETG